MCTRSLILSLTRPPCSRSLLITHSRYRDDLGHAIANFARVVPDGLLVFFPAYSLLTACLDHWKASTGEHTLFVTAWRLLHLTSGPQPQPATACHSLPLSLEGQHRGALPACIHADADLFWRCLQVDTFTAGRYSFSPLGGTLSILLTCSPQPELRRMILAASALRPQILGMLYSCQSYTPDCSELS
jgi:hypothetical protein